MSSISPVGPQPTAVSGIEPVSGMSPPPVAYLQGTLGGIGGMLSMSTSDLRSALKSGASIADLAAAKGVGLSSIVQSVEQQVQQGRAAQGKPPIDQSILDAAVNRAVHRHRHHHHHAATGSSADAAGAAPDSTSSSSSTGSSLDLLA